MTRKHDKNTEDILKDIPNGKIIINRHNSTHENTIFNKDFRYCSDGRGLVDTYSVFPGIELSFNYYYANCFEFQHRPVHSAMQINHCRSGRMGWKMQDQSTIYLGPGDLSLHTLHSCADSAMNLPLGYYQGVSVFIDLNALTATPPDILSEAGINGNNLYAKFCEQAGHTAIPASEKIEHIFSELYDLPERMYLPYFKLKVKEISFIRKICSERDCQSTVCMVCTAVGKRNKISQIIETYSKTLQEKAEYSEGLSSQSDQMDCRIL